MPDALPDEFWLGVDQFNQRQFYDCHDTLEALWIEALEPDKTFYQGILQIAVALYHLGHHNWRGAVILMGEGINRLRSYPSDYGEIDLDRFLEETVTLHQVLQSSGPDQVEAIAQQLSYPGNGESTAQPLMTAPPVLPKLSRLHPRQLTDA